ncbi:hypothetical protein ACJMK2_029636 [Sinanodonta woodiana]|uniref:Uncharacterized protein n=1 Tax=Sinanodonta woodiana TaxID=1069815 RepID=A0ABD3XB80_SINWO
MSDQNESHRAEMEVKPRLQNAILAHHLIQAVSAVVICLFNIYKLASIPWRSFHPLLLIFILLNIPIVVFVILWIASKCRYQDMRFLLVHFNSCLSALWFIIFLAWCIITPLLFIDGIATMVQVITGLLSLSSAMIATYGIWKMARNVILSSRGVQHDNFNVHDSHPPTVDSPDMYADITVQRLSEAHYIHPI